ncbi:hypothetical protein PFICI_01844 [Pestalotiopsis fici W106-1]|uniref:MICOS complex subunit n=1 Tax=Pestalotiopsis fici (strain W106-1 / CGMCC3.15140) TaxID=1229662 RepID=W3XRZ2_PESFW|nr:uncharacterized protein PFICI_01844 [Pestalotiopsis fici W106-1]ETS88016.1 hypothetical protein PFICI_01844 [Pestalotiopsis fici W106-1]
MAARVLLGRRVAAPFMAATLAGGALIPSVAFAEAPEDLSKKPIYDDFEIPIPQGRRPNAIALFRHHPAGLVTRVAISRDTAAAIGRARLFLYEHATRAEDAVNRGMDQAFHLEKSFTQTVASLAPPRESGEQLMPGLVYVLVAGMAGSIVSRNRNILLRAAAPLALGVGAGWLVLPVTMNNVSGLLWKYEQKFPVIAEAHIRTRENIFKSLEMAKVHSQVSRQYVDEKVTGVRDAVEDWVKKGK